MEFLIVFLGLLPGFAWLFFFLKEDIHPEPKKMIAKVFIVGALFTFVALGFQIIFQKFTENLNIADFGIFSLFGLSAIEEIFKFLAAYLVVRKSKFFDEPVDAMIYMIVAALGFATMENIAVAFNMVYYNINIEGIIKVMTLRFIGATLLHALASGIVGFYWAKRLINYKNANRQSSPFILVAGLTIATVLHTIFNYLIILKENIFVYPIIFLIIIAFFVLYDFEKLKKID